MAQKAVLQAEEAVKKEEQVEKSSFKCSLTSLLGKSYEEFAIKAPHLHDYVHALMEDPAFSDIPLQFKSALSREDGMAKKFNIIYPASDEIFIHVYKRTREAYGTYKPIEPCLPPDKKHLLQKVEELFAAHINEEIIQLISKDRKEAVKRLFEATVKQTSGGISEGKNELHVPPDIYRRLFYETMRDKVGLGVLEPLIRDPYIEDISCNGVGPIFIEHKIFGSLKATIGFETESELNAFIVKLCERIGRPVSPRRPIVDASLPDGSRLNVVFGSDISKRGSNFTIRKFSKTPLSITQLVKFGTLNALMAAYLWIMLEHGMSLFICGETASGKTTTLNAITVFIRPTAKIITIEDTPEVYVPHPNWVRECTRKGESGESSVELYDLLKAALRQRPNYIIVGEIRGKEGHVAFQAMQTGHPVISTFHAGSIQRLIQRITGDPINIPPAYVDNLNLVVFQNRVKHPKTGRFERRVTSICEIIGYDPVEESYSFIEIFSWDPVTDKHVFRGVGNSYLLEYKIAPMKGLSPKDARKVYKELELRAYIISRLVEMQVFDYFDVHAAISKIYDNPYIADIKYSDVARKTIDKMLAGITGM